MQKSPSESLLSIDYAVRAGNVGMLRLLADAIKPAKGKAATRVEKPACLLQSVGTGAYNQRTFGMRRVRLVPLILICAS